MVTATLEQPQLNMAAPTPDTPRRRLTEHDAAYRRLHAATVGRLSRTIRRYVRALRHPHSAARNAASSFFIHEMTDTLRDAYTDAHRAGQAQYWSTVSKKTTGLPFAPPSQQRLQQRLAWY